MENRYYVQCLSPQVFLIRERVSKNQESSSNDRLVKSFDVRHDAYMYVDNLNEEQKKINEPAELGEQHAL